MPFRRSTQVGAPGVGYANESMRARPNALLASALLLISAAPALAGPADTTAPAKAPVDPLAAAYAVADGVDSALEKAVAAVRPCSVTVWNAKRRPGGDAAAPVFDRNSGGSGVLVTWKGKGPYIVSNEHVVQGADRLEVAMLDGSLREVRVKDRVKTYDIALLEFVGVPPKGVKTAKLGKSELLKEGQWVFATGNPFFLGGDGTAVATLGVISGLNRTLRGSFTYANAIQHDTEVNPGNSGGPLWSLAGELVGINGMISSRPSAQGMGPSNTGASFAIPFHLIAGYFDALLSDKVEASAGNLGLDVADAKAKDGKPMGATVKAVRNDSPLTRKGAGKGPAPAAGDVVTRLWLGTSALSLRSYDVFCSADLTNALAFYPSGSKVRVRYQRGGKDFTWEGELGGGAG